MFLPKPTVTSIAFDHQMAIIQVQVGKNFVENTLLNGGSKVIIIMEILKVQIGLSKLKLTPYNLCMTDKTIVKPLGLIKYLKILVHGIPYAMTFTIIQSSVLNSNYSMLLGRMWLKDAKVFHNWGNNIITLQRAHIVRNLEHQPNIQKC
jgi:hypothetical protein